MVHITGQSPNYATHHINTACIVFCRYCSSERRTVAILSIKVSCSTLYMLHTLLDGLLIRWYSPRTSKHSHFSFFFLELFFSRGIKQMSACVGFEPSTSQLFRFCFFFTFWLAVYQLRSSWRYNRKNHSIEPYYGRPNKCTLYIPTQQQSI